METSRTPSAGTPFAVKRARIAAGAAVSGASADLPFSREIQRSFGDYDLSAVRATTGGDAARVTRAFGASAYTLGERVAFERSPNLRVAAHEAAHVIQQRVGVDAPGGVGAENNRHERHADAVADLVVAHRSAVAMLDRSVGARAKAPRSADAPIGNALQFFFEKKQRKGQDWRISEHLNLAVSQENGVAGGKRCYAESRLITEASERLARQKSALELTPGSEVLDVEIPGGSTVRLRRVVPANRLNKTAGNETGGMSLIPECGWAANQILHGEGTMTQGVHISPAQFNFGCEMFDENQHRPQSPSARTTAETRAYDYGVDYSEGRNSPNMMMEEIFEATSGRPFATSWKDYLRARRAATGDSFEDHMKEGLRATNDIDARMGINKFAQPNVGEAYSVIMEKNSGVKWPKGKSPYVFHWATVILRSGGDSVTLEAFADSEPEDWNYQMYGPSHEEGQTFHEQQMVRQRSGGVPLFGLNPTTIRVQSAEADEPVPSSGRGR